MSDGGFIYEKITITSNSSAYATRNDWCVFVHLETMWGVLAGN